MYLGTEGESCLLIIAHNGQKRFIKTTKSQQDSRHRQHPLLSVLAPLTQMRRLKLAHAKSHHFCDLVSSRRQSLWLLGPRLPSSKYIRMWCLQDLFEKKGGWGGETSVYSYTTCTSLLLGQLDTGRRMLWEFLFFKLKCKGRKGN